VKARSIFLAVLACGALAACGSDDDGDQANGDQANGVTAVAPTTPTVTTTTGTETAETGTETQPLTEPPEPRPSARRSRRTLRLKLFKSPSSNIGCAIYESARCDIREHDWSVPPRPASCEYDYGPGLTVGRRGRGTFVCAGDTALDPRARVLRYGKTSRVGKFSCTSAESGVRCRNTDTGHGFRISRERYRVF
jgi:hypothetical protein